MSDDPNPNLVTATPRSLRAAVRDVFRQLGGEENPQDVRLMIGAFTGVDPAVPGEEADAPVDAGAIQNVIDGAYRLWSGEPLARILGGWEFWGLPFHLTPACLIPRADTETVVEAAVAALSGVRAPKILDLGVGPGAILISLLHERGDAFGVGLDRSEEAARVACFNAAALGLAGRAAFVVGDWAAALSGRFDLLVSNPPYIETAAIAGLDRSVREHDPLLALDGGADGLDAYRAILADAPRLLAPGGALVVEIGIGQAPAVEALAGSAGLTPAGRRADLAGIDRALTFRRA